MIKIGLVGQDTPTTGLISSLSRIPHLDIEQADIEYPANKIDTKLIEALAHHKDLILFQDLRHDQMSMIRQVIKHDTPIFFLSTTQPLPEDIKEITKLSSEAGTPVFCYNPYWFDSVFYLIKDEVRGPFLMHLTEDYHSVSLPVILSDVLYQVELSLLLSRGTCLRSDVKLYRLTNHSPDLLLIELEYDSGSRTEIIVQKTDRKNIEFIFRAQKKITTWHMTGRKVHFEIYTEGEGWKRKVKKFSRSSDKYHPDLLAEDFYSVLSGNPPSIPIEERYHTAVIFHEIREKVRTQMH